MSMRPGLAVIPNQVICNLVFGLDKVTVAKRRNPLRFKTPEKSFHWSVIPAIYAATHALFNLIAPKLLTKFPTGKT